MSSMFLCKINYNDVSSFLETIILFTNSSFQIRKTEGFPQVIRVQ